MVFAVFVLSFDTTSFTKIFRVVQLGMAAGVSIRYAVALDAARKWTLRAHGKFGLQGIEAEAGVSRKLRGTSFAGYAVNVNIGVCVKQAC